MNKMLSAFLASSLMVSSISPFYVKAMPRYIMLGESAASETGTGTPETEPTIEVRGVEDGAFYNTDVTPEIIVNGTYKATLDGWYDFKSGSTIQREGTHTLTITATIGAKKITKEIKFTIDKTAPMIETNLSYQREKTRERKPNIYVRSYEDATLYYSINGNMKTAELKSWKSFYFNEIEGDGTYTLSFYVQDKAGNKSQTMEKTFTIKSTGPQITVSGIEDGGVYRSVTPVISVNEGTYEARYDYWDKYIPGTPFTEEGSHTLTITAKDELGNVTEKVIKFRIDSTGPEIRTYGWDDRYIENSTDFSVTSPIKLKFSEPLNVSTLNERTIQLRNMDTGQLEQLDFSNMKQETENDSYRPETIVIIPVKEKLKSSSKYRLTIDTASITDVLGNPMNTRDKTIVQDFQTRKFYDALSIVSTNLDKDEISSAGIIKLVLDGEVTPENVQTSKISLRNLLTGQVVETNIRTNETEIWIEPKLGLSENTTYQLDIEPDAILSKDGVPMRMAYSKTFKTADLFTIVSGPESTTNERRPELTITFTNPVNPEYVNNEYFTLMEDDLSNRNEEVETTVTLSTDRKTVKVIPAVSFESGNKYKLVVSSELRDIYGQLLVNKEDLSYPIEVGTIETNIQKPSDISWSQVNFKTIKLSWKDNSLGESGYYLRIDGDKQNEDYQPSVKGIGSTVTFDLVFDKPLGVHSVEIIPADEEGEEDEEHAVKADRIKLTSKKPEKPANVRVKLLKDGSLEWTWKDIPSDYPGETAYIIIRKGYTEKASQSNRIHSSKGRFVEKIDLSKETVINNKIIRYISRSVNVEGTSGADLESDKVKYEIKLPAKPPTATVKRSEYNKSNGKFTFEWTIKDSKNVARKYSYILKRNNSIVGQTEQYTLKSGQTSVSDTIGLDDFDDYYYDLNEDDKWQVVVVTYNALNMETYSAPKDIIQIDE